MDYADVYGQNGDGMNDTPWDPQTGPPGDPPPGYHWDPTQGWVPDRTEPVVPRHGGTQVTRPGDDPTAPPPAPTPNISGGALANFSEVAPAFPNEPAFQPLTFTQPTFEEAMNDPGQKFRVKQGEDSLQNWAAARGTLNDSGTAKSLIDYGQAAAAQGYGDVYARNFNTYQANEGALERTYGMNRQSQYIDPWTAAYNSWAQRGNWYLQNQGTVANTALGFANL